MTRQQQLRARSSLDAVSDRSPGPGDVAALNREYVELTLAAFPNTGISWHDFSVAPDPAPPRAQVPKYHALLGRLAGNHERTAGEPPHQAEVLRASTTARLFDLEVAELWRYDPQFWVEQRCYSILRFLAADATHVQTLDRTWLRSFIAYLPALFDAAKRLLDRAEVGKADLMNATRQLAEVRDLLVPGASHLPGLDERAVGEAAAAAADFQRWCTSVGQGARRIAPTRAIGAQLLSHGFRARAGVRLDLDGLERLLRAASVTPGPLASDRGFVPSEQDLRRLFSAVVDQLAFLFPEPEFLSNLDLLTRSLGPFSASARYSPARPPRSRARAMFDLSAYGWRADLTLDIVHECVGHHWQYSAYEQSHHGHAPCWYYENDVFIEGWARYCEYVYASLVDEPDIWEAFSIRLARYAAQALAALLIHGNQEQPGKVTELLVSAGGWPQKQATSLAARAYLDPWRVMGPALGYLGLRQLASANGDGWLRDQVLARGTVDLSQVVIGCG